MKNTCFRLRVKHTGRQWQTAILAILAVFGTLPAFSQAEHPVSGRRIAPVMGIGGADWLERHERDSEEMPEKGLDYLQLKNGMVVADIGAGVGYITLKIARRVAPEGKVYANEIQPQMLSILRRRAAAAKIGNIEAVLGTETDPRLPANSLDMIVMVDVYHEFSHPQEMLRKLRGALKSTGKLVLFEYKKEDPYVPIKPEHKMSVAEAKLEVEAEGFRLERTHSDLPWQHVLVFARSVQ